MAAAPERPEQPEHLVGKKVSILYRLENDSPEHPFSEVVGVVQRVEGSEDASSLFVRKRDGSLIEVAGTSIVRLKVIPT